MCWIVFAAAPLNGNGAHTKAKVAETELASAK